MRKGTLTGARRAPSLGGMGILGIAIPIVLILLTMLALLLIDKAHAFV